MAPYEAGEVGIHKCSLNFVDSIAEVPLVKASFGDLITLTQDP